MEGLNFALQYQGKNEGQNAQDINVGTNNRSSDSDVRFDNGDGFGLSTSYDFGMGISAAAAYTSSDRTGDQQHYTHTERYAKGDKADAPDRRPEVRRQRYLHWRPCTLKPAI